MDKNKYEQYIAFYRKHPKWISILIVINKILTLQGYLTYPFLLYVLWRRDFSYLIPYLLIPGISFLLVTIYRKKRNCPRPYEDPEIDALCPRNKKGESFPSRHLFSYELIAVLLFSLYPAAGVIMILLGILMAYIRVILGVHYPKDVAMGGILGILCGVMTILLG